MSEDMGVKTVFLGVLSALIVVAVGTGILWAVVIIAPEMGIVPWILGAIVVLLAGGWVMRLAGQKLTGNKPFFRDMPLAVAFGYVLGVVLILFGIWYYFQPAVTEAGVPVAPVQFFRWAVQGVLIGAAAAYLFRLVGRVVGTAGSRKVFRKMPLTAAFGVLVILIYAFLAIFAPALAPHGQEEVFSQANIVRYRKEK